MSTLVNAAVREWRNAAVRISARAYRLIPVRKPDSKSEEKHEESVHSKLFERSTRAFFDSSRLLRTEVRVELLLTALSDHQVTKLDRLEL
ncbi:hypothetical protein F511_40289 [Dorcoceras hygrometricum]|uniref:Uncharacterized protein n=1 Tax=Dorcoceras hygrometricum TaxID=472368 RepID=A0A2Z7ALX7_9LAMI|nr:hypothetical protein F511_40289 [Dorcoceras hygrometricum]